MKFLEKFKTTAIAVNCETKEETKEFFEWLGNNGISSTGVPLISACFRYFGKPLK